ncbi:MAG: aminodeoxychorismate/anthranilate synthase component II [Pseudomonadota bacterium]
MLLVIDNYDSFTFNLVHYLQELGAETRVVRNDVMSAEEALALGAAAAVISPGPCDPDKAGICLDFIERAPPDLPILGVCLGHQAIGQAYGGEVVQASEIMHGKTSDILHQAESVFAGLPSPFTATRYHSLAVRLAGDSPLKVTARTEDGEIMGLSHSQRPVHGVQFHPESIASQHGHDLLANFLTLSGLPVKARAA